MKITGIDCHVLLDPEFDVRATSSAQDGFIVEIQTDEGLSGIGETDANPWMVRECIQAPGTHTMGRGLSDILMGRDPLEVEGLWQELYIGSAMNGRRGLVVHAIGALEMALQDLRGKAMGMPVHRLLGESVADAVEPYASLQPDLSSYSRYRDSMVEWAERATAMGYKAVKAEVTLSGPYAHKGMSERLDRTTEIVGAVRDAVGSDTVLMVDVQYAFPDAETCLETIKDWSDFDVYFLETPLPSDDLDGYARLAESQDIPIAAGEWLSTRYEFRDLIEIGRIAVAQPDIGRVGGLGETLRVAEMCQAKGVEVVPHVWKTGLSISAAVHVGVVSSALRFVEFLPRELCDSALRRELFVEEPVLDNGVVRPSDRPGLGVEIDRDALERFAEAARKVRP